MGIEARDFRNVPDWPKPGIQFKDIGPVLRDPGLLSSAIGGLVSAAREIADGVDFVIAPEARGFLFGPALAAGLGAGFIPARKPSKLPPETHSATYELEYGEDSLHIAHGDLTGSTVLIHDDLLATGGTAAALSRLITEVGAVTVGAVFLSEIAGLAGRGSLGGIPVRAVVRFED